jgi:hypothetical protein
MAPLNASFRKALTRIIKEWQAAIAAAIKKAQAEGRLSPAHDPKVIALYITANYGGARNMGKVFGAEAYTSFLKGFKSYIYQLN